MELWIAWILHTETTNSCFCNCNKYNFLNIKLVTSALFAPQQTNSKANTNYSCKLWLHWDFLFQKTHLGRLNCRVLSRIFAYMKVNRKHIAKIHLHIKTRFIRPEKAHKINAHRALSEELISSLIYGSNLHTMLDRNLVVSDYLQSSISNKT